MDEEFEEERVYAERPNKTQIKRDIQKVQELAESLVALPESDLEALSLSANVVSAVLLAKKTQKSALKRQMKYVTGLLRNEDVSQIQDAFDALKRPHRQSVEQFHQLENWRDSLLSENTEHVQQVLQELMQQYDTFDMQHIRQLIRNAAKEKRQNKPSKSARLVFQYLQNLMQ